MKTYTVLLAILSILCFGNLHAQEWLDPKEMNPPTGLTYSVEDENDVNLFWNQPSSGASAWLHWDSGENEDSFGFFLSAEHFACAARWETDNLENYDGWTITKLRFFVTTADPTIQLKIWTGEEATEVYSQDVTDFNFNDWTEVILDEPFVVDAGMELRAGIDIDMPFSGAVMGTDSGPAITGYGDLVYWNGTWYDGWTAGNHNIQIEVTAPSDPVSLHWDSGENEDSFGFFLSAEQFSCAGKWDPVNLTNYDGWNITKLRFYVTSSDPAISLKLWEGPNATEVYTQDVPAFEVGAWTEVVLDVPYTIDASTELWGGIDIDMPFSGSVMGTDGGPAITGYGDLLYWNGTWYDSQSGGNWNIQLELENPASDELKSLLGYNVYRDDQQLNAEPITSTAYVDFDLSNGLYDYYVTALYDEGESDSSNHVLVQIDQPVIVLEDSLALVDLYNNCNGVNWASQDQWLTGPVSEWYGITTTGTRVTGIWITFNNLTGTLPESFGNLTALESLHFESNEIDGLPESFGNLESLEICWLGWTNLTSLPESFGNLDALFQLHLGFLNLGELPESFGNLSSLTWLALGDSQLNSLPENFGSLTSLVSCFIWGNNLTELPESFGNLESLRYLAAYENQLTTLPDNFGDLDNLSQLLLEENQLQELPESFGDLESLDSVYLYLNQLTALPANWGDLDDLNYMNLSINSLESLPASFSDMATIEEIYLGTNQLEEVPADIGNLSTLLAMSLNYNNITELPESITELESIQWLVAANNSITAIPEGIGSLSTLKVFVLDGNQINSVPESIGDLMALGYISLGYNNIDSLPVSFGYLEADTVVLSGNAIHELPPTMFDNEFHFLYVDDNALQFGSLEPLMGQVIDFQYEGQAKIGEAESIELVSGDTLNFTIVCSGENNTYTWYKDGEILPGQTTNTLTIESASASDQGTYHMTVSNSVVPDLVLTSYDLDVSYITGLKEQNHHTDFSLYPNPLKGRVLKMDMTGDKEAARVEIRSLDGQLLVRDEVSGSSQTLDVSDLMPGIYVVEVCWENGVSTAKKLIIQ